MGGGIYRREPHSLIQLLADAAKQNPGCIAESDFTRAISNFDFKDFLCHIGDLSIRISRQQDSDRSRGPNITERSTGMLIAQHHIAYLANMAILSDAVEDKGERISRRHSVNIALLCYAIEEGLPHPLAEEAKKLPVWEQQFRFVIRAESEQFDLQLPNGPLEMCKAIAIFQDATAEMAPPAGIPDLPCLFEDLFSLTINDYLKVYATLCSGCSERPGFKISRFPGSENFHSYLDLAASDRTRIAALDKVWNEGLDASLIRFRLNPLKTFPIVALNGQRNRGEFCVPCYPFLLRSAFWNVYWRLRWHFEERGQWERFTEYVGKLVQHYVGMLLKSIFPTASIVPEFTYHVPGRGRKDSPDWLVLGDRELLAVEVKTLFLGLASSRMSPDESGFPCEYERAARGVEQLDRALLDIGVSDELSRFRRKVIRPLVVTLDLPLANQLPTISWFDSEVIGACKEKGRERLTFSEYHMVNLEDLEAFGALGGIDEFWSVLRAHRESSDTTVAATLARTYDSHSMYRMVLQRLEKWGQENLDS